ncbi:MAG: hypothetical protein H7Y22_14575 [Gemmatimonadaceae bacterium]|nr:hypothetical protein [Gloeobacterales cyanobacterium ES-bin-141]
MPRRRSRYRKNYAQDFSCPLCLGLISRLSGQRYYLSEKGPSERDQGRHTRYCWQGSQGYCDLNHWLEEFYCPTDGRIWMSVKRTAHGQLRVTQPEATFWERAIGAIDANRNPTVGEFTSRMSKGIQKS